MSEAKVAVLAGLLLLFACCCFWVTWRLFGPRL